MSTTPGQKVAGRNWYWDALIVHKGSVVPGLMRHRRPVQLPPEQAPGRKVRINQPPEALVVCRLQQVHEFVGEDVLHALRGFLASSLFSRGDPPYPRPLIVADDTGMAPGAGITTPTGSKE